MNVYKIRVTGDVLETSHATRRIKVAGQVLTFGREPVYVQAAKLPPQLADDPKLRIEAVDSAPAGVEVLGLKAERVQDPVIAEEPPGDEADLKAERVQDLAVAEEPPGDETDLKAERVQDPAVAEELPGDEAALKAERVQQPARKRR